MASTTTFYTLVLALLLNLVAADYDSFYFTSVANNQCAGIPFNCPPPFACSHDATVDKYYCCIPGQDNVCWTGSTSCSGRDDQTAGGSQLDCGSYCCLESREQCTQRSGQVNICWATAPNPLVNITDKRMNDTFSSLSSRRPAATSFTFALAQVTSTASTTPTGSSTAGSSTTGSTSSRNPSSTALLTGSGTTRSSSGLSGGAIAGIVVGVVLGLGLIAAAAFFILRSRKRKVDAPSQAATQPSAYNAYNDKYRPENVQPGPPPVEMYAGPQPRPIQEWYGQAAEMESTTSGTHKSHNSAELPGTR